MIISTTPGFIKQNLIAENYAIRDVSLTSPNYFNITFFPEYIGGGVSLIKLRGNAANLLADKLTEIEILDSQGNPVRYEVPTYIDRFENYYISIQVYDSTAPGIGSVSMVGVATKDLDGKPVDSKSLNDNGHNVIWTRPITILPYERNNSELVFDDPPYVTVAQIIAPARVSYQNNLDTRYSATTSSNLTITTANFKGFDQKRGSNFQTKNGKVVKARQEKITDQRIKQISLNINSQPLTVNSTPTTTRASDRDVVGGYVANEINKYNTVVTSTTDFFSSSYVGGQFEFFSASYDLSPSIPNNYTYANTNPYDEYETILPTTQSLVDQLNRWTSTIVKIKDTKTAYLTTPVQVNLKRQTTTNTLAEITTHTFQKVSNFTASLLYMPQSSLYVTSSEVSQSYIQFTIQDLKPIGGDVYKIKVFYRRGSQVGDWTFLQDQVVRPLEFLTDARYPNQTSYGYDISEHYLIGHFTNTSTLTDNWSIFNELSTTFDTATASLDTTTLADSIKLTSTGSWNKIMTTRYYQNYPDKSIFSLNFNCTLEPYTELELYENSSPLATTVFGSDPFPRAFNKTLNTDLTRYSDRYNRFGKLIGKVSNQSAVTKHYGKLIFDFKTDSDGLGRPLFRVKQLHTSTTASAYISEVGISPRQLNGFTPKTVQFAFPAKDDFSVTLSETIDYKLEYYDYTGNQSEYVTYLENIALELSSEIPTNACQAERAIFCFKPLKYYACTSANSAVYSVFTEYPQPGSMSFEDPSGGGGPYAYDQVSSTYRFWPDWDTQNASGFNAFKEIIGKLFNTVPAIHYPNFDYRVSSSYASTAKWGHWNTQRPVFRINGNPSIATTYQPYTTTGAVPTTSSWQYVDNFTLTYDGNSTPSNVFSYAYTSTGTTPTYDGRHFVLEGGLGISTLSVSNSYASYSRTGATIAQKDEAIKKRRLFWPFGGSATGSYFTENGGIYNVKFKLKKYASSNFDPDPNSFMRVFIFDASSSFMLEKDGTKGWYPPSQNIVKIGNSYSVAGTTTPAISFTDSATGYSYDEYNINLVQYGTPAQLVFEACAEGDSYFGIVIDDIEFCKIGVTTDPYYIKPTSIASSNIRNTIPTDLIPPSR